MSAHEREELLIRIDERVTESLRRMGEQDTKLTTIDTKFDGVYQGLSRRVTALENFRWWLLGVIAVTTAGINIVINYWKK